MAIDVNPPLAVERLVSNLVWFEGAPSEPGVYLFRLPTAVEATGYELAVRLTRPESYRWEFRNVYRDSNGWLCCLDSSGDERVVRSEISKMHCDFARVDC